LRKDDKSGKWIDIGDKKAAEKTSQALREKTNESKDDDPESPSAPFTSPTMVVPTLVANGTKDEAAVKKEDAKDEKTEADGEKREKDGADASKAKKDENDKVESKDSDAMDVDKPEDDGTDEKKEDKAVEIAEV
jgi:hypothetical protein